MSVESTVGIARGIGYLHLLLVKCEHHALGVRCKEPRLHIMLMKITCICEHQCLYTSVQYILPMQRSTKMDASMLKHG